MQSPGGFPFTGLSVISLPWLLSSFLGSPGPLCLFRLHLCPSLSIVVGIGHPLHKTSSGLAGIGLSLVRMSSAVCGPVSLWLKSLSLSCPVTQGGWFGFGSSTHCDLMLWAIQRPVVVVLGLVRHCSISCAQVLGGLIFWGVTHGAIVISLGVEILVWWMHVLAFL